MRASRRIIPNRTTDGKIPFPGVALGALYSDQLELDESFVDGDVLSTRVGCDLPELQEIGPDDHVFREVTRHDEGVRDRHALQLEEEADYLVRGESPLSVAQLKRPRGRRSQQPSESAGDVTADQ